MQAVDIVLGMQYGSEGKGKIVTYLASGYKAIIRSGGPQAGHSFYHKNTKYVNRQIPCGVFSDCFLYLAPAALIDIKVLEEEITRYNLTPARLRIDKRAMVVTQEHVETEKQLLLDKKIASTCQGVGAAQSEKILRTGILFHAFVKGTSLEEYSADVPEIVHGHIAQREKILLEGTQGFGLSLNHGHYPFVTSKDVTASALLNDCGLSPKDHHTTIGVLRTYPIRVGGNSGPTDSLELTWEDIEKCSGATRTIREYTTVTGRLRRVFEQDFKILERAILVNKPDLLALTFLDYLTAEDYGKNSFKELSERSKRYILGLEERLKVPILLISTGPETDHIIDRR